MQSCGSGGEPPSSKNCNTLKQKGTGTLSNYQNATKNAGKIVCGCPQDKIQSIINGDCEAVKKRIEAIKEAYEKNQKIVIYKCDELSGRMSIADVCFENLKYYDYNLQGDSISIDPAKYTVMKTTNSAKGYEYWAIVFEGDVLELRVPTTEPDAEKKIRALAKWLGESGANETTKPASFPIKGTQLKEIFPGTDIKRCEEVAKLINKYSDKFEINTPEKMALFLGQIGAETGGLKALKENVCYKDKDRIKFIFGKIYYCDLFEGYNCDWNDCGDGHPGSCTPSLKAISSNLTVKNKYVCSPLLLDYVYSCRMGNSTPTSGDGSKYFGKGFIHLTGKDQYKAISDTWNADSGNANNQKHFEGVDIDELSNNIETAMKASMYFWEINNINHIANKGVNSSIIQQISGVVNVGNSQASIKQINNFKNRLNLSNTAYKILK